MTTLIQAGLPPACWPMAASADCAFDNTEPRADGFPPWYHTHGTEFSGYRFPFGCAAIDFPSNAKESGQTAKWEGAGKQGIFASDHVGVCYTWSGQYLA